MALRLERRWQTQRMLKNYLKTAFRNIVRQKGSTIINVAGLTLGITCSLVLFLMVKHLSTFDSNHTNRERIFRVVTESDGNSGRFYTPGVPSVLPDAFRDDFHEAEEVTFLSYRSGSMVSLPDDGDVPKKFKEDRGVVFAEPAFFRIFDRKILSGSAEKGLDDPNEAIISESLAKKYFPGEDPIGKSVKFDTLEYKITAVMEDHPANTDFPFSLMLSYITIKKSREANKWNSIWSDEQCYVLLKDASSAAAVSSRMPAFVEKYLGKNNYEKQTWNLQPLSEIHFDERYGTFSYSTAPKAMLVTLGIIALLLIVTACINFINLTTAEAIKRSKEVGIRKSLGSSRVQLVTQFLGETTMVTLFAMIVSLGFAQLGLTFLNSFMDIELKLDFANDTLLWGFILGVTVMVSLLSGLYPSFVISGYKPVLALKNQISNKTSSGYFLRRALVVLQFSISQMLIIGTLVIITQMTFFQKQELGFQKDAVVVIPVPVQEVPTYQDGMSKMRTLRNEIASIAGIEKASLGSAPPSSGNVSGSNFYFEGQDEKDGFDTQIKQVDGNYIDLYDLQLIAGKGLDDLDTARGFVVNEKLTEVSGVAPQDIIGKKIKMWGKNLPVVGVVKDFHTVSLREPIEPTVMMNRIRGYSTLSLRVNPSQMKESLQKVKTKWEAAYPEHIFEYEFLDEQIREFYEGEQRMSILLSVFTSIAIFIGCLGLFGLASFVANQKRKEIGVRKVLGASVESIVLIFTKEFVLLIFIGFALAAPLAWFGLNAWLNDFAYKIELGPGLFLIGLVITLLIAVLTVGYKSVKTAIINPVHALRYE
jgi:putative ABC transport system permease protein